MICGNTQAEIDRDQERQLSREEQEERSIDAEIKAKKVVAFVELLMTGGIHYERASTMGNQYNQYDIKDAYEALPQEHAFWSLIEPETGLSFGEYIDQEGVDGINNFIATGQLPIEIDKEVRNQVELMADFIF